MDNILISSNGDYFSDRLENIDSFDYIIAVDGGIRHLVKLGIKPHLWVGDMDSSRDFAVEKEFLDEIKIQKLPEKKDISDSDYAIEKALELKPKRITLIGGIGSRIDHSIFNINLFLSLKSKGIDCVILDGKQELSFVSAGTYLDKDLAKEKEEIEVLIENKKGKTFSIVPFSDINSLSLNGFEYPLNNRNLDKYTNLTLSNKIESNKASIKVKDGEFLIVISDGY